MDFLLRKAVEEDAVAIAIVSTYTRKTAFSELIPADVLDERIKQLPQIAARMKENIRLYDNFLVATVENTVVAVCTYLPGRDPAYRNCGEIGGLYCLEGYQGYGIGKALFQAAAERLRGIGFDSMILNCLRGNPTLGFYERMGGRIVGERQDVRPDMSLTEDILYYDLNQIIK